MWAPCQSGDAERPWETATVAAGATHPCAGDVLVPCLLLKAAGQPNAPAPTRIGLT